MDNDLQGFADALRAALNENDGATGKQAVCNVVASYLLDTAFTNKYLPDREPGQSDREVLYEDPELGFCICGHVFPDGQNAAPHDHGPSWAIYGQVSGQTEMTDWTIVDSGSQDKPLKVEPKGAPYVLNPGDVHLYDVGAVHSLVREGPVKTIRIEGENLDQVKRSHIVKA